MGDNRVSPVLRPNLAVADVGITVSAEVVGTGTVTFTVQLKDSQGSPLVGKHAVKAWISDTAAGVPGTAPSGAVAATAGLVVQALTAKTNLECLTDATGKLVLTAIEAGALENYLNIAVGGKVWTSAKATWAA